MTPEDLAAIRARNADPDWTEEAGVAIRDVRALLAEVDRLRENLNGTRDIVAELGAELHTLTLSRENDLILPCDGMVERERIRAAVRGLPGVVLSVAGRPALPADGEWVVSRADVLAAIDGADLAAIDGMPPTTITDLPDIGTGYPEGRP